MISAIMSPSSAYSDPSPSGRLRILEIKLRSADLDMKKNGRVYVKLSIHPDRELQTSVKYFSRGSKLVWEEKFIFSVSENFLRGRNSNDLFLEVYRAHKFLKDELIGTTCCDLKSLFQQRDNDGDKDCSYDTSEIDEYSDEEDDPRFDDKFDTEIDDEIDEQKKKKKKKKKKKNIIPAALTASASLIAAKGLKPKAKLNIEVGVWEGFIGCVGDHKWREAAMPYNEFMGLTGCIKDDKKRKVHPCMCFTGSLVEDEKPARLV